TKHLNNVVELLVHCTVRAHERRVPFFPPSNSGTSASRAPYSFLQADQDEVVHAALHSLYRVFKPYIDDGAVYGGNRASGEGQAPATVARKWLKEKFDLFV